MWRRLSGLPHTGPTKQQAQSYRLSFVLHTQQPWATILKPMLDSGECYEVRCAATSAATTKKFTVLTIRRFRTGKVKSSFKNMAEIKKKRDSKDEPTWGMYQSDLKRSPNDMLGMR